MTHPIDTSPEAIAALIARYTKAFGLASEAYDKGYRNAVKEMAAEIARLTAERDEARALLAILHGEDGMGNVTPTDATAALAAMRNEGRRQAALLGNNLPDVRFDDRWTDYEHGVCDFQRAILATLEPEGGE